jgi:hypothetical protein
MLQASETDSFFADPPMYTLYITASLSPETRAILFLRKSPRATLGRFVGFKEDGCAPDWTRWTRPTLEFQQPKTTFAELFVRMATWEVNALQVCGLSLLNVRAAAKRVAWLKICTKACQILLRGPGPPPPLLLYLVGSSHSLRGKIPFLAIYFQIFRYFSRKFACSAQDHLIQMASSSFILGTCV